MNSFNNEFVGTYSAGISFIYFKKLTNLRASAYSGTSFFISYNNGKAMILSTPNSYISDVLNIASAVSWYGNIFFSSPLFTLCHVSKVCLAE